MTALLTVEQLGVFERAVNGQATNGDLANGLSTIMSMPAEPGSDVEIYQKAITEAVYAGDILELIRKMHAFGLSFLEKAYRNGHVIEYDYANAKRLLTQVVNVTSFDDLAKLDVSEINNAIANVFIPILT